MTRETIKAKWNKLSEEDLNEIDRDQTELSAKIQTVYGRTKPVADKEVADFKAAPKTRIPQMDTAKPAHI